MDKEKQVEEMYQEFLQHKHDTMCEVFSYKGMCENFINLGYRKINENEVVISKDYHDKKMKELYDGHCNFCHNHIRKKTAREILTKLQPYIGGWVLFKELEKEFGVEIKE